VSANTITLNGKVYDSTTGSVVGSKPAHKTAPAKPVAPKKPAHKPHHKAQKARTLMRHAVKKPVISAEESVIVEMPVEQNESVALFIPQLSESRLKRAEKVHKSKLISRFGDFSNEPTLVKRHAHIPVRPHPVETINSHGSGAKAKPSDHDIFTASLSKAESHKHAATPAKHHRAASKKSRRTALATSAVAIALLGGFFAYQNKPNMEFRVAAARAGVNASLPGYHPSGFAMSGPIEYAPGQLTIHFSSNSDDRNFSLTQKISNWNDQALHDNYVASAGKDYQTIDNNGQTIYVDNEGNATWVNKGVWYQVEGSSSLTNAQLLKIASSI
jgi:hypothetical protein